MVFQARVQVLSVMVMMGILVLMVVLMTAIWGRERVRDERRNRVAERNIDVAHII